jgi:metal-responsive CopG/Arc/MetJ family transcriptional regulator
MTLLTASPHPQVMSTKSPQRKNYTTGVSLEPEVVRSLDELAARSGLNRSWVLNTIVREYLRLAQEHASITFPAREAIIKL